MSASELGGVRAADHVDEVRTYKQLRAELPLMYERCAWELADDDPWFFVVRELSRYIKHTCEDATLVDTGVRAHVGQVKEKWGGLRFYVDFSAPDVHADIERRVIAECTGAVEFASWLCAREPW